MPDAFSRERMLLGEAAVQRLRESHVIVFGLGGVGSFAVEALARAGVGELTLVDHDTISITNLNRQLYALHSTLGRRKVDVARERVRDINPDCNRACNPGILPAGACAAFLGRALQLHRGRD